eukprot:m.205456 g.205456  ORF g.205456 m.205456 type:complete len:104 (-) comp26047_c3_seq4:781-1092(-)
MAKCGKEEEAMFSFLPTISIISLILTLEPMRMAQMSPASTIQTPILRMLDIVEQRRERERRKKNGGKRTFTRLKLEHLTGFVTKLLQNALNGTLAPVLRVQRT